ncbi:hypothetical protein MAA5396_05059 [Marinovum algicola]|uniref:DUF4935 domain-containing protein n=1 Tax=Marinovum algicola TaxID=42444 RepID=A0A975WFN3_9RHOB|nr:PIN domain-containing protein [Marinovum algicola]SEK12026.1 protein of unknown function [Marinovum algicola]SLN77624.1 hypothetical protein MAA5396_05059 [Marinovum algicola]
MTTIYIDTNIFMNESFFRSAQALAFLKACSIVQVSVVIPEIVIDEVLGNYPKKLRTKAKEFQRVQRELGRLIDIDMQDVSVTDEVSDYEDWLYQLIDEKGVVIAPYPKISVKELVDRSYCGEKPFKESGEGHKDFLVWETVKEHIDSDSTTPPNFFVTNNVKDFGGKDEADKDILFEKLAEQIEDVKRRPVLFTSLRAVFDKVLAPHLQDISLDEIPDLNSDDIQMMTERYLLEDLPQRTAFGFEGVPFGNDVNISGVGASDISEVTLKKVDDEVVIFVSGSVEIEVDGFMEKHSYYSDVDPDGGSNVYVVDSDWNNHVMAVSSSVETAFELSIVYSVAEEKVTGYQIALPDEIESDWYQ